ncbi:MAG: hypothetical protein AB8B61_05500 [Cyclobacteriaceae bacterium]
MPLSIEGLRKGYHYRLTNFGESHKFEVMDILYNDCLVKDLLTLEVYKISELYSYGKGDDFEIEEIRTWT